jgi:hypothetical protein
MQKILCHDFGGRVIEGGLPLNFGFLDKQRFFVEIRIPIREVVSGEAK